MMDGMHVEAINIGPGDALGPVRSVRAIAGHGLEGDRYFFPDGAPSGEALTLIEAEALDDVGLTGAQSRRQVVVRGVAVNDLVGKRFRIGDVECAGVELCEPCLHLQKLTRPGIIKDLIHRGDVVLDPALHAPTDRIDAHLRLLPSERKPIAQWLPGRCQRMQAHGA